MRKPEQESKLEACYFSFEYSLQQGLKGIQTLIVRNKISCMKLHYLNTSIMDHFENLNTDTENSAGAKLGNLACRVNQFILHLEAVKIFWAVI